MMKRVPIAVIVLAFALGLWSPAAASGPAQHFSEPVVGDTIACESGTYTGVSGETRFVIHQTESQGGTLHFTGTSVPHDVKLVDQSGDEFFTAGAASSSVSVNTRTGGRAETLKFKLKIVSADGGGAVGTLNITTHISPNGDEFFKMVGTTCEPPQ